MLLLVVSCKISDLDGLELVVDKYTHQGSLYYINTNFPAWALIRL
jgi:hypothetical protein